jgi:hypothetical protein
MAVPDAPAPRFAVAGAVIESAPTVTVKVTMVSGSAPFGVLETRVLSSPPPMRGRR